MADEPDFLIATAGAEDANSYLTLEEANERMNEFESFDAWDALEDDVQARLLIKAARIVDRYRPWGKRHDDNQRLAFPREIDGDGIIPDAVKRAVLEYVDFRLLDSDGSLNSLKDLQAEGVTQQSILGQSTSFEKETSQLPAGARRELDKLGTYGGLGTTNRPYHCGEGGDSPIFG
jgi:hypothetical protein